MKTAIIILAAGSASRMQRVKQLLPLANETLLGKAITTAQQTHVSKVCCVLGAHENDIRSHLTATNIDIIKNEQWEKGMGSSVACGVHHALETVAALDTVLLMLADQPMVTSAFLTQLLAAAQSNPSKIIASTYQNTTGVPVIFPKIYFDELCNLSGEKGAKQLLWKYSEEVIGLATPFENIDLDTPEDYLNFLTQMTQP